MQKAKPRFQRSKNTTFRDWVDRVDKELGNLTEDQIGLTELPDLIDLHGLWEANVPAREAAEDVLDATGYFAFQL